MPPLTVITPEPPAQDVIATLERALEQARTGDISSVALAFVHRDGAVSAEWSALPSRPAMPGSISRLAHRINIDADD